MHSFQEVLEAALKLPEGQRELLADLMLGSVESEFPICEAWLAEIRRRSRQFDENPASGIPWEEVKAFARRSTKSA
jgi:putative addiction module component (TIGR02574 family)